MLDKSIKKTLVIGSGPIIIGQAAEFDYSGTQACETLKKEGIEVILINSNPATIMTDKAVADKIYIEPITAEFVEKVIAKERPDSILAGMGGQTALNMAVELNDKGILEKYNVRVIGTSIESIKRGEDRELFREAMDKIGEPTIESKIVETLEEGFKVAKEIGYPVVVRPAYTLGGTGGGIADNPQELENILLKGLKLSRVCCSTFAYAQISESKNPNSFAFLYSSKSSGLTSSSRSTFVMSLILLINHLSIFVILFSSSTSTPRERASASLKILLSS